MRSLTRDARLVISPAEGQSARSDLSHTHTRVSLHDSTSAGKDRSLKLSATALEAQHSLVEETNQQHRARRRLSRLTRSKRDAASEQARRKATASNAQPSMHACIEQVLAQSEPQKEARDKRSCPPSSAMSPPPTKFFFILKKKNTHLSVGNQQ